MSLISTDKHFNKGMWHDHMVHTHIRPFDAMSLEMENERQLKIAILFDFQTILSSITFPYESKACVCVCIVQIQFRKIILKSILDIHFNCRTEMYLIFRSCG